MLLKRKKRSVELVLTPPLCGNVHNFLTLPLENDIVCVAKLANVTVKLVRVCPLHLSGYPRTLRMRSCSRGATQVFNFPSGSLSLSLEASFLLPVIK